MRDLRDQYRDLLPFHMAALWFCEREGDISQLRAELELYSPVIPWLGLIRRAKSREDHQGQASECPLHQHVKAGDEERIWEVVVIRREHPLI